MNSSYIHFSKMHGAGNDFVVFDNRTTRLTDSQLSELARVICNRRFGVGADGLIALQFDETRQADLEMLYKNPDGSDAGMCGNGARCFAVFAVTLGSPEHFQFRVHNNIYKAEVDQNFVQVQFPLETSVIEQTVDGEPILNIYTNTEHIVCSVPSGDLEQEQTLITRGRALRTHRDFQPAGTNVNFISGTDKQNLQLQTYERGVEDLTLACGTGAIASALGWHHLQLEKEGTYNYNVTVKGGVLKVRFTFDAESGTYHQIALEGTAEYVFNGEYYL